ncbi:MAG: DUF2231 domain-containing protein [Nocardioides sp.]
MELNGLPLHPLIVHLVVVVAPLAALTGIAYAARPGSRWLLRWPLVVMALVAAGAGLLAAQSGQSLEHARHLEQLVHTHRARGNQLKLILLLFLAPVGLGAWFLGGPSGLTSGAGTREGRSGALAIGLQVLLVVGAVAVLVWSFLTGDSGARAVWGQ